MEKLICVVLVYKRISTRVRQRLLTLLKRG